MSVKWPSDERIKKLRNQSRSRQKSPRLNGKCPSCGVNFSDHASLVGTCSELKMLKDKPNWYPRYSKLNLEYDEAIERLNKFKPIHCKDRMPKKEELPVLVWAGDCWVASLEVPTVDEFWMPMPPPPE